MTTWETIGKEVGRINTILLVVFITLKLIGLISWSWIWVLAPFWIPVTIATIGIISWFAIGWKQ